MTVEQPTLPVYTQKEPGREDNYTKIEEVTGINDRKRIDDAIATVSDKTGAYEVEDVIQMLVTEPYRHPVTEVECYMASGDRKNEGAASGGVTNVPNEGKPTMKESGIQTKSDDNKNVIDLTNENVITEKEQIQKAIEESLKETSPGILGGQISREEQEISRVLEQSLQESKAGTKRKRGDIWFVDPLNPHERKRDGNWPVGLKNVGNTCWFSAVVQSLYHLPAFRRLVLNFTSPTGAEKETTLEKRNLQFMEELRRLFALMVLSKRKYVDPSKAVEILKEAFSGGNISAAPDAGQQDVSEFQHKLLEWLEDAFRYNQAGTDNQNNVPSDAESADLETSTEKQCNNPMVQLFYGQFMAEGTHEGGNFTNKETFGQFPLQVDGFGDIHESLEAGTAQVIETVSGDPSQSQSGQELWFTKLPPVLTFELSRFQFNQQLGRPEKIHNKLEFHPLIYLDRYLESNKCITRRKRKEVKKMREDLKDLQDKLDKFTNYGSGTKRFPLQDVLQYALEFAQSKDTTSPQLSQHQLNAFTVLSPSQCYPSDMEVESPSSHVSMQSPDVTPTHPSSSTNQQSDVTLSPISSHYHPHSQASSSTSSSLTTTTLSKATTSSHLHTPTKLSSAARLLSMSSQSSACSSMDCETPTPSPSKVSKLEAPSPKHVSQQELLVLQSCLRRWRTEVENDVKELQDSINDIEDSVNQMYSEEELKQVPYKLHAVLVHEGQAASGHYWAYVFSERCQKWLKFNDITVSESSWEELAQDSFGGYHNASAYCLMYVDGRRKDLLQEEIDNETGQSDVLPIDLQKYVNSDNAQFDQEIEDWDNRQNMSASASTSDIHDKSTQSTQTQSPVKFPLALKHSHLAYHNSAELINAARKGRPVNADNVLDILKEVCQTELARGQQLSNQVMGALPKRDYRLCNIQVYLHANHYGVVNARNRILFEQFSLPQIFWENQNTALVAKHAKQQIHLLEQKATENEESIYMDYHEKYAAYRKVVNLFISGVHCFQQDSFPEALSLLCSACDMNKSLTLHHTYPMRGLDKNLVAFFRRQCLLHLNELTSSEFERGENMEGLSQIMNRLVLPCLGALSQDGASIEDEATVEEVRERWCSFLNLELPEKCHEKLQEFLSRMFDPPSEFTRVGFTTESRRLYKDLDLQESYHDTMDSLGKCGYLDKIKSS